MYPQQDPLAGMLEGIKTGAAIRQIADERTAREQALQMQEQYKTDL